MTDTMDLNRQPYHETTTDTVVDSLQHYHDMRMSAMGARFEDGQQERLAKIQDSIGEWVEGTVLDLETDYGTYNKSIVEQKMYSLVDYLLTYFPDDITKQEIHATQLFIESTFGVYDAVMADDFDKNSLKSVLSYAFLVPGRASRKNEDYGAESELIIPILRYVPNKYRSLFIHGVPPFILDFYEQDEEGDRGAVICALVSPEDMFPDKDNFATEEAFNIAFMTAGWQAIQGVNNATEFARRLGAEVAGFGAVLPRITDYGTRIDKKGIFTTTGHAGTIVLIFQTINAAIEQGIIDERAIDNLAIAGLGKIGASIAHLTSRYYPHSEITVFDSRESLRKTIATEIAKNGTVVQVAQSMKDLLSGNNVVISAITSQITTEEIAACKEGLLIIDDSQPACVNPEVAMRHGATVAWVVGMQENGVRRQQWGYGTFADNNNDLFGCEIETAILFRYRKDLAKRGYSAAEIDEKTHEAALTGPVTPEKVLLWRALFDEYGIKPAKLQSFGKYVLDS